MKISNKHYQISDIIKSKDTMDSILWDFSKYLEDNDNPIIYDISVYDALFNEYEDDNILHIVKNNESNFLYLFNNFKDISYLSEEYWNEIRKEWKNYLTNVLKINKTKTLKNETDSIKKRKKTSFQIWDNLREEEITIKAIPLSFNDVKQLILEEDFKFTSVELCSTFFLNGMLEGAFELDDNGKIAFYYDGKYYKADNYLNKSNTWFYYKDVLKTL